MDYSLSKRQITEKSYHNKKYNKESGHYNSDSADQSCYKYFYSLLKNVSGKKVLDYGCGDGWLSFEMAKKSAEVWGIDISEELVKRAIAKRSNSKIIVQYMVMPCETLSFQSNSFDLVVGSAILHHTNISEALNEIKRVLRPSGHAYFIEPMNENIVLKIWRLITPWRRSPTERALMWDDILLIKKLFPNSKFKYFTFISILTSGLMIIIPNNTLLIKFNTYIENIDRKLIYKFKQIEKYCAVAVIDIKN